MAEDDPADPRVHWESVYGSKAPQDVSWFQNRPDISLELVAASSVARAARILNVGGGASTFVDHLLAAGFANLAVLDISERALTLARARLGDRASAVAWIVADVTTWVPDHKFDLWHDRAVLHFLTKPSDQAAYALTLRAAVKSGGAVIIAGFAPGGPVTCSGLVVVQHDAASLSGLLGDEFKLAETRNETHFTPRGAEQAFRYHLFRRSA